MNRTENMMLYICDQLKGESTFGSTVFNKVLYYMDSISYLKTGSKISDFDYIKQKNGPTPEPSQLLPLRDNLMFSGKMGLEEKEFYGKTKKVPYNKVDPVTDEFSSDEMELMNKVIAIFRKVNGSQASYISHTEIAWEIAENKEKLPMYTFLLSSEDVLDSDVKWAKSILGVHN